MKGGVGGVVLGAWIGLAAVACGDDTAGAGGAGGGATTSELTFDPQMTHFGRTYAEWGAAWWSYLYAVPALDGECVMPDADTTGALCGHGQDPSSPVFFLVGTAGGNAVRDACTVPADKAIFFPILTYSADNGGVPEESQLSAEQLRSAAEAFAQNVDLGSLVLEVDGEPVDGLDAYHSGVFEFSYVVPPEPNRYSCLGVPGVEGEIAPVYGDGYFALLRPLAPGPHVVRFAGRVPSPDGDFALDVTYELTVQ